MGLVKLTTNVYTQLESFFNKLKLGQAPEKFSQQHLRDMGFTSTNHRAFIPILKGLGFLSSDGTPTNRYLEYRNDALSRKVMGEAIKEAYGDIFTLRKNPTSADEALIQGKFKSEFNASDNNSKLMMRTFFNLLDLADISDSSTIKTSQKKPESEVQKKEFTEVDEKTKSIHTVMPSLNYNIQIHLPATKDIEVYNSIFKSIKENLLD